MWYIHVGAPAHFSRAVRDVLSNTYHDRWIGRGGPTAWPPRSPDLNPLDFYRWGHLKPLLYAAPTATDSEVPDSIPGASRFCEKQRVWNGVHSAS
jgi:hypothetical protein